MGDSADISVGLPQGGVLSPLLWLLFFNDIPERLETMRALEGSHPEDILDLFFADDMTTLISDPDPKCLSTSAMNNKRHVRNILGHKHLQLQDQKTYNILYESKILSQGIYRRTPPISIQNTKTRLRKQHTERAKHDHRPLDFDPTDPTASPTQAGTTMEEYPHPLSETVKILGVTLDNDFTLDDHMQTTMAKAQLRQAILSKVANTRWGLGHTVLSVTHDALVSSLLRYAMVITGSCYPGDLVDRVDVAIINTAARKISGLHYSTRLEVLHFLAGTNLFRNLYSHHCALFVHRALCASDSGIRSRLAKEICAILQMEDLYPMDSPIYIDKDAAFVMDPSGLPPQALERIQWMSSRYAKVPDWCQILNITSTYHVHAQEIKGKAFKKKQRYLFGETHS